MIQVSRIEKAAAHRARVNEVKGIFSFVKQAEKGVDPRLRALQYMNPGLTEDDVEPTKTIFGDGLRVKGRSIDYEKRRARLKMLILALTGTYAGSLTGANVAALNGGKIGKGALIGAGVGTALGAGLGAASNSANRWAGIDPLVRTVAIAKS